MIVIFYGLLCVLLSVLFFSKLEDFFSTIALSPSNLRTKTVIYVLSLFSLIYSIRSHLIIHSFLLDYIFLSNYYILFYLYSYFIIFL